MFHSQFKLTGHEEKGLRQLCIFFTRIYVKAWHMAPLATAAPNNDLQLLKALLAHCTLNSAISKATSHKMADHLWYLSETLVGLAFFDSNVSHEVKDKMVKAMAEVDGEHVPPNRVKLSANILADVNSKSVADFVTKNTRSLFTMLRLPQGFFNCQHHSGQTIQIIRLKLLLLVLLQLSMTMLNEVWLSYRTLLEV